MKNADGALKELFFQSRRVLIDASFREEHQRSAFLEAASRWAVPAVFLVCQAEPGLVRQRLALRRGDASDADWSVYLRLAGQWETPSAGMTPILLSASENREQVLLQALAALAANGIY